jgi:hypothetical protein
MAIHAAALPAEYRLFIPELESIAGLGSYLPYCPPAERWLAILSVPTQTIQLKDGPARLQIQHPQVVVTIDVAIEKALGKWRVAVSVPLPMKSTPTISEPGSTGSRKKGHLGLEVDEDKRQVRRNGCKNAAEFEGNVKAFQVFLALHRRRDNYFRTADLVYEVWGDSAIERGTLYTTISMTKKIISGLGVIIISRKNLGYQLVEGKHGRQKRR